MVLTKCSSICSASLLVAFPGEEQAPAVGAPVAYLQKMDYAGAMSMKLGQAVAASPSKSDPTATPETCVSAYFSGGELTPCTSCTSSPTSATEPLTPTTGPSDDEGDSDDQASQGGEVRIEIGRPEQENSATAEETKQQQQQEEADCSPDDAQKRQKMLNLAGTLLMLTTMTLGGEKTTTCALASLKASSAEDARMATRLVARAVHLMLACGYPWEEVELIGAQATSYMERLLAGLRDAGRPEMELLEMAHVFCLLMYVAHIYVEDEHCPAKYWHGRLFLKYCDMRTMNAAVHSLLQNLGYGLRVEEGELDRRLALLREHKF